MILEIAGEGIFGLDKDGRHTFVNEAAARMLGYDADTLIGTHVLSYIAAEYHETVIAKMAARKEGGEASPYEIEMVTKNGPRRSVIVKATPIRYQNNPAILLLLIDITERNLAEKTLQQTNRKLNLLSSITRHDILNLLTVIIGHMELVKRKQYVPSFDKHFNKITGAAERIHAIIQFTKTYESIGVNTPVWQDLHILMDKVTKDAQTGKVLVNNDIPDGTEVFADPMIVNVFYNLLDNAIRYGGKITTIRFAVEESGDEYLIICEDDGDGIPADEKEKIFERGFGKNTGLGLFLSREILSITGITIREIGEPGEGARFEIVVPKGIWRMVRNDA